jgi:hypothetical protein
MSVDGQGTVTEEPAAARSAIDRLQPFPNEVEVERLFAHAGAPAEGNGSIGRPRIVPGPAASIPSAHPAPTSQRQQTPHAAPPRLTDTMASGINEATGRLDALLEAHREAYGRMFGPPPLAGASSSGADAPQALTTEGRLTELVARLQRTISDLEAVSYSFIQRI